MSEDTVVVAGHGSSTEGLQVSLHPLPLLSISEHYTRVRIQSQSSDGGRAGSTSRGDRNKVIGALIGVQNGREIEIVNSFELALTPDGQDVNHEFFATRQAQCGWSVTLKGMALRMAEDTIFDSETPSTAYNLSVKQVFPSFEFLGWYTVGTTPTPLDLNIHTQLLTYNESPIFLQLRPPADGGTSNRPSSSSNGSNLPLEIYESVVDIVAGKSVLKFVRIAGEEGGYKIETGEAERIAVESASRTALAASGSSRQGQESVESSLVAGLTTQRNAIAMLHSRIEVILQYLDGVQRGTVTPEHETLRQVSALVSTISTPSTSNTPSKAEPMTAPRVAPNREGAEDGRNALLTEFEQEENDILLTSLLGQMTKALESTNSLVDKFSWSQHRDSAGGDDSGMLGVGGGGRSGRSKGGRHRDGKSFGGRRRDEREFVDLA